MPQYLQYPPAEYPQPGPFDTPGPRILISQFNGHRILLPEDGELVLGRFDPDSEEKPDIDLSAEDQAAWGISRRHLRVIGWRGQYEIEDLGSSNGTQVNEEVVEPHTRKGIQVGDEIRLGGCIFYLGHPPLIWRTPITDLQPFLYVTFNEHYYPVPLQKSVLIGRADPKLELYPDIDLSNEESSVAVVSRRHVRLTLNRQQFLVEDLESSFGTRLNGEKVYSGIKIPIHPGQHLWLGGYTIAFDAIEKP
ncbi:MAG: FHA domain-containing protein [Anaerolineae bacterium]|nr:FHA domain-containing protein [Anaerolineae bacterium]